MAGAHRANFRRSSTPQTAIAGLRLHSEQAGAVESKMQPSDSGEAPCSSDTSEMGIGTDNGGVDASKAGKHMPLAAYLAVCY
jgi:hypothetical protein